MRSSGRVLTEGSCTASMDGHHPSTTKGSPPGPSAVTISAAVLDRRHDSDALAYTRPCMPWWQQ